MFINVQRIDKSQNTECPMQSVRHNNEDQLQSMAMTSGLTSDLELVGCRRQEQIQYNVGRGKVDNNHKRETKNEMQICRQFSVAESNTNYEQQSTSYWIRRAYVLRSAIVI